MKTLNQVVNEKAQFDPKLKQKVIAMERRRYIDNFIKQGTNIVYVKELSRDEVKSMPNSKIDFLESRVKGDEVLTEYHLFMVHELPVIGQLRFRL